MYHVLFELPLGDKLVSIESYVFFGVLGALYFLFCMLIVLHQYEAGKTAKILSVVVISLSFLIGARILYTVLFLKEVLEYPELAYSLRLTNFSLYGGLALAFFSWWSLSKWYQLPFLKLTDKLVPPAAVSLILFRTGCFLSGCCFGKTTELAWGVTFPRGSFPHKAQITPNPFSYFTSPKAAHPTQLYEIFGVLIALFLAWFFWKKYKISGLMFTVFVLIFTSARAIIHFFRYYPEHVVWPQTLQAPIMYGLIIITFSTLTFLLYKKHYQLKP